MKIRVLLISVLLAATATHAQHVLPNQAAKTTDSLKQILAVTSDALQRFNIIYNLLQNDNKFSGKVESALCVEAIQIAESLKSYSLLGIAYNRVGTYFSLNKGDDTAMQIRHP